MDEQEILRILTNDFNLHWDKGHVAKARTQEFKRRDFFSIADQLKSEKITSIIGPRRVGKTTIMFQLIDYLIKELNVDSKRIIYVSMDNEYLIRASKEPLKDMLDIYMKYILKDNYSDIQKRVYVFLDEIQHLQNWQKKLKSWFDYKYNIKFILSGSSSLLIQKDISHLIGRISERIVFPLKFSDFLDYYTKHNKRYYDISKMLRDSLKTSLIKKNPEYLMKTIKDLSFEFVKRENEIEKHLQQFMIKGGYPELLDKQDYSLCSSELRDTILSKSILDIIERYGLRNISLLKYLFSITSSKSGSKITYQGLSKDLAVERPTIISHLDYLEDAFLLSKSNFYSRSVIKRARKEKKYYVNDIGMRNSVVGAMNESLLKDSTDLGIVAETIVFDHTKRLRFFLSGKQTTDLYYWSDNVNEIDIILDYDNLPIPIEVKFRKTIEPSHSKTMRLFMKKNKSPFGIMVTKNYLDLKDNIIYIPLSLYLLIC
ncbi:MAG: ATP-binding protein [Candidatus Aenigmatarchaeota archaeon]